MPIFMAFTSYLYIDSSDISPNIHYIYFDSFKPILEEHEKGWQGQNL